MKKDNKIVFKADFQSKHNFFIWMIGAVNSSNQFDFFTKRF